MYANPRSEEHESHEALVNWASEPTDAKPDVIRKFTDVYVADIRGESHVSYLGRPGTLRNSYYNRKVVGRSIRSQPKPYEADRSLPKG